MSGRDREGSENILGATLSVRWVQGFPVKNIAFINNNTICYPCGNFLIFMNIEKERRTVLQCMNGKVGAVATNIPYEVVAFSDQKLKPSIYIYNFPALTKRAKLRGNAQLDYTLLEFSYTGIYLASYSAIPEHEVTLWNWETNVILCRRSQPGMEVSQMTFNPKNWRQLCLSNTNYISIWNIERCNKDHYFKPKSINLPTDDGTFIKEFAGLFSQGIKDPSYGPVLPYSAVAGLVGIEAEYFKPKGHFRPLLHPIAHCWNTTNEIYVCCEEGHILLINGESLLVTILSPSPDIYYKNKIKGINSMAVHKGGLFVSGKAGILHSITIKESNYTIKDHINLQAPVENIVFSPDYKKLLLQTENGSVFAYTFEETAKIETILDASGGNVQAIDFVTLGNQYCMSVTILGEFYIWLIEDGYPVSRLHLKTEVSTMACCPSSFSVAVGPLPGYVLFLDISDIKYPRLVHKILLTRSSIQHIHYDQHGTFLIIGTSDRHIFLLSSKASDIFKIIGFSEVSGNILQISTVCVWGTDKIQVMVLTESSENERSKVEMFTLADEVLGDSAKYSDERGKLKNELFARTLYEIDHPLTSAILDFDCEKIHGFCRHVPYICTYGIPQKASKDIVLKLENKIPSKHYGTGMLYLSYHGRWLASTAKDGILTIRDSNSLEPFARARCHSYQGKGIRSMIFSLDGQSILVNGEDDGALVCLKWKSIGGLLIHQVTEYFQNFLPFLNNSILEQNVSLFYMKDTHLFLDSLYEDPTYFKKELFSKSVSEREISWLQKKNDEATKKEIKEFSEKKKELKEGIKTLTKTIHDMIEENELASEIAQLEQQEFSLDVEEMERLQEEGEEELEKIKKEAEMGNLAKKYLCYILKKECWHSMNTKGRSLKSFHGSLEVQNFPMKSRTPEELEELETVLQLRKTEKNEYKLRKEIVEFQSTSLSKKDPEEEEEDEEEEEEKEKKESNLPNYLLGSLSSELGADTSMLYSQLELHTREEKINQIILLKDIIYNIKTEFNKDFDIVYRQKELEITRINERNTNIQGIITELDLGEQIWQPVFEDCEKPDRILVVEDHEIKVERILTPWEKEQAALAEALERERRLLSQRDDARRRALMDMMGGVLEVKKEDILRMVIPQPACMAKPDALWTEEEKKIIKEYEKKVKDLNEEREKYKKSLDAELRKLQNSIQETTQTFDDHLRRLFKSKVKCEMVINQEELKIANLTYSLLLDEELRTRELELNGFLERKQKEKKFATDEIYKAREELDTYRDYYDGFLVDDKILERGFKKEFAELHSHLTDTLYKIYKRRPRPLKQKQAEVASPFGERQGSAQLQKENFAQLMNAMEELDNPVNMPEGLEPLVWTHLCTLRRTKMESEQKVKQKALVMLEIQTFLRKRTEDDEKIQMDIEKVLQEILILQEEKMNYQLDMTIQLLLTQGQVEMENFQFLLDFTDSILINRVIIEDINSVIRAQGQKKVTSMVESKDFHKGIFQIEWEHKKMEMEMEDLNQKAWDIQMLFFSRDRQRFLNEPNYEVLIGYQIAMMEQNIAIIDKAHKREVEAFKKLLKQLGKFINQRDSANYILSCELQEELVTVSERRQICKSLGSKLTCEKIAKERYDAMLHQQKLVDISKSQAEQITILQAEVERLRMKTFPALVQL
ncbi:LOW QUALITY PROTEIN: cilia- and flagella-associated protein 43-like [Dromiciops gliroides]|uniref:LOW QUALITY PROTEIN: cilia- and flagella-associated protein 43-like n=1 Tax=Dromiciops gliroides TaxID=33562 RepID=UPI001CC776FC|nr:LOW QUALITY PROTEIN: cilia- and flagella-associated protein 43-like [Dromiciops gliroides]